MVRVFYDFLVQIGGHVGEILDAIMEADDSGPPDNVPPDIMPLTERDRFQIGLGTMVLVLVVAAYAGIVLIIQRPVV